MTHHSDKENVPAIKKIAAIIGNIRAARAHIPAIDISIAAIAIAIIGIGTIAIQIIKIA